MHNAMNISILSEPTDTLGSIMTAANVVIALCALFAAMVSVYFTRAALRAQLRHNKLSVRPMPLVIPLDFENRIAVEIRNNGIGPLIIKDVAVVPDGGSGRSDLIEYMPGSASITWSDFNLSLGGTAVLPGRQVNLIELAYNSAFDWADFATYRNECRRALAELSIRLAYTDMYGDEFPEETYSLDWFGRHGVDA
jgi:hypothetical protein